MLTFKTWLTVGFAVIVVWTFGSRLADWLLTGRLFVTTGLQTAHYVVYADDPAQFAAAFLLSTVMVGAGLMYVWRVILDEQP